MASAAFIILRLALGFDATACQARVRAGPLAFTRSRFRRIHLRRLRVDSFLWRGAEIDTSDGDHILMDQNYFAAWFIDNSGHCAARMEPRCLTLVSRTPTSRVQTTTSVKYRQISGGFFIFDALFNSESDESAGGNTLNTLPKFGSSFSRIPPPCSSKEKMLRSSFPLFLLSRSSHPAGLHDNTGPEAREPEGFASKVASSTVNSQQ